MKTLQHLSLAIFILLSLVACITPIDNTPQDVYPTVVKSVVKPITTPEGITTVTAAQSLNVRSGVGMRSPGIGILYNSEKVTLTGQCLDGWAQIVWKAGRAWVNAYYLSDNLCQEAQ